MTDKNLKDGIVAEARLWIGTPYLHQASVRGRGADCLGLVRGIWRDVYRSGTASRSKLFCRLGAMFQGTKTLLGAAQRWFEEIGLEQAGAGDLVCFRWGRGKIAKHLGLLTAPLKSGAGFIHAYERAGVVETTLGQRWQSRVVACFQFPSPEQFRQK